MKASTTPSVQARQAAITATLGALDKVDGAAAVLAATACVQGWTEAAGLPATEAWGCGRRHLLWRLAASRPAFAPGHRQALLISACLDAERPYDVAESASAGQPHGRALARGGLLTAYGLVALLEIDRLIGNGLTTGRDLVLSLESRTKDEPPAGGADADAMLDDCAVALAEGGGYSGQFDGARIAPVAVAQKGTARVELMALGEGAAEELIGALARVADHAFPLRPTAASRAFLQGVAEVQGGLGSNLAARGLLGVATHAGVARRLVEGDQRLVHDLLHDTALLCRVRAGVRPQGRPRRADAILDCSMVPGRTVDDLLSELRAIVGDHIELTVLEQRASAVAPLHGPMLVRLCEALEAADPTLRAVPTLQTTPGDAIGWRQEAIPCYGFAPLKLASGVDFGAAWRSGSVALPATAWTWGAEVFVQTVTRILVDG